MTQLHTPKASRNQETGRLSFMGSVSLSSDGAPRRGGERRPVRGGTSCPRPVRSRPCPPRTGPPGAACRSPPPRSCPC
nr:DUF5136 domain-containing protein [Streptomyces avermitilis]